MDQQLQQIVERFAGEINAWLSQPSEAKAKIDAMKAQVDELKATVGAKAVQQMLKGLEDAEKTASQVRAVSVAETVTKELRALGVPVEVGTPMKRRSPKKKARSDSGAGGQGEH